MLDPYKITARYPTKLRNLLLDWLFTFAIPFNWGQRLKIEKLEKDEVIIRSPKTFFRKNHVGGAHACALALMGEYPAGLLLAKHFPFSEFRPIISELKMEYFKQGKGDLRARAVVPKNLPKGLIQEEWIYMETEILNRKTEIIAKCQTKWQIKSWKLIEEQRKQRALAETQPIDKS